MLRLTSMLNLLLRFLAGKGQRRFLQSEAAKNAEPDLLEYAHENKLWLYYPDEYNSRFQFGDDLIGTGEYTFLEIDDQNVWFAKSGEELRYLVDIYIGESGDASLIERWSDIRTECEIAAQEQSNNNHLDLPQSLSPETDYAQLNLYIPYFPVDNIIGWDEACELLRESKALIVVDGLTLEIDQSETCVDLDDGAYEINFYSFEIKEDLERIYQFLKNVSYSTNGGKLKSPRADGIKCIVPFPAGFPKLEAGRSLSKINAQLICYFSLPDEDLDITFEFPMMSEDGESNLWIDYS